MKKSVGTVIIIAVLVAALIGTAVFAGVSILKPGTVISEDGYLVVGGEKTDLLARNPAQAEPEATEAPAETEAEAPPAAAPAWIPEQLVGTQSMSLVNSGRFYPDYTSLTETLNAATKLNIRLAEEGIVLLKNDNAALPLTASEREVTLLGWRSADIRSGGGGSGMGSSNYGVPFTTLEAGLTGAGFSVNTRVLNMYRKLGAQATEPGLEIFTPSIEASYGAFRDAAIVVIARSGSEGTDLSRSGVPGHTDPADHFLQLEDNEKALIRYAKQHFGKVIVLINTGNAFQLTELAEAKTAENLGVDAILLVGYTGNDGAAAIGEILAGTVNPSGHTVDTHVADLTKDPTWTNFGDNSQVGTDTAVYLKGEDTQYRTIEYRENIYADYRYYETVYADKEAAQAGSGDAWYAERVVYPFGWGLSYTDFEWALEDMAESAAITAANETVTMRVRVTNVGGTAGKDVVQIYASQPYTPGGIEKAGAVLVGFAKTDLLQPGESETVTVSFVAQDMASFDWNDANGNGFVGYELEAGTYVISARQNAHDRGLCVSRTVGETILCATDYLTGNGIVPVFSQTDGLWESYNSVNSSLAEHLMSRGDMTQPAPSSKEDRTIAQADYDAMQEIRVSLSAEDDEDDVWYVQEGGVPEDWTQAATAELTVSHDNPGQISRNDGAVAAISLADMMGVDYAEPVIVDGRIVVGSDEGSRKWDAFMNQFTWEELCEFLDAGYGRPGLPSVGKSYEVDTDGPAQMATGGNYWINNAMVAATWNLELAERQGRVVGNESLFLDTPGWYAPSTNIHRSAFGGRNFEYYSADGLLSGKFTAAVTRGAASKGLVTFVKHCAVNDQETDRGTTGGLQTWVTEQAIREIYLKPFEIAIKEGKTYGIMQSFNCIGIVPCARNAALTNAIMRGEWGFRGISITDGWSNNPFHTTNMMIRNGVDAPLVVMGSGSRNAIEKGRWDAETRDGKGAPMMAADASDTALTLESATQWFGVRRAAMHMLYVSANSNGIGNALKTEGHVLNATIVAHDNTNYNLLDLIDKETLGTDEIANFALVSGDLPEGIELTGEGFLTGTASDMAEYTVNIQYMADGWVTVPAALNISVRGAIAFNGDDRHIDLAKGEEAAGSFFSEKYQIGTTYPGYGRLMMYGQEMYPVYYSEAMAIQGITYTCTGDLPAGVTLNADGSLTGTPTEAGEYQVVVTFTADAVGPSGIFDFLVVEGSLSFDQTFTITVQ